MAQEKLTVLILAAGEEVAWEKANGAPKQLLSLGDETILGRIVRQVRKRDIEPTLVTHREDFIDAVEAMEYFDPAGRATIADTILHTRELWGDQTVILLADVIFSNELVERVTSHRGGMTAFGCSAEIFAWSFCANDHNHLVAVLEKVIADKIRCKKGSPWQIYRVYCGREPDNSYIDKYTFEHARDRTGDVDSLKEYHSMCRAVREGKV